MQNGLRKVLVTGADGFIGSHLTEYLCSQGFQVRCMAQYNSFGTCGWLDSIDQKFKKLIEIRSGDIRDFTFVKDSMLDCDWVFHLAALIAIPYSYKAPESYVQTNIVGTLNVVQAAKELGTSKVIHTSTSEVYGSAKFVPITEEHPLQGQSPYSASKIGADQIAMSFFTSFNTPVSIVRPFNTYGPRQSTRAVIPTIISQIAFGKSIIEIGALEPTRDFNFVADTVHGFLCAANSAESIGEVINIGSNFEISIHETAKIIAELMHKKVDFIEDPARIRPEKSEVSRLWADNSKAKKMLNWSPIHSGKDGFKKGLIKTIEWFTNPENLKYYKNSGYAI